MWDDELSSWLINNYGFRRCLAAQSIFIKEENGNKLVIVNAVDDQLYFSTCEDMRKKFEEAIAKRFDVDLLGQAHCYLQSRVTQSANFDVTVDQLRYIALIVSRFLPNVDINKLTDAQMKRFSAPLTYDFLPPRRIILLTRNTCKSFKRSLVFYTQV